VRLLQGTPWQWRPGVADPSLLHATITSFAKGDLIAVEGLDKKPR
jgi:hypothetical protein